MKHLVSKLQDTFIALNKDTLDKELLATVYSDDIHFQDPLHEFQSIDSLVDYFERLYKNVEHIKFDYGHVEAGDQQAFIEWKMLFLNKKFNKGREVSVNGVSHLKAENGKIVYHRDYFDSTHMIYNHVPVLNSVIAFIKNRL
jgi:limonene-1,2-epoxide hydrolase